MLQVDLSTLRGPELRRLLDATRQRGQAALSYEILQEMASRRERREVERPRGPFSPKRASEPRVIAVDLGDPLESQHETEETEDWDPPEAISEEATFLQSEPPPPPRESPPRRFLWVSIGLAIGLIAGVALGWWSGQSIREPGSSSVNLAAATSPSAVLAPRPLPEASAPAPLPAARETPPAASTETSARDAPSEPASTSSAEQDTTEVPQDSALTPKVPNPAPETRGARAATEESAPVPQARTKNCSAEPNPADQAICGDQRLQRLQRELQKSYAAALDAHQDRALLRQRQLAWRDARNAITDPDRLAQLYEQRIRKLNAATAAALQDR